MTWMKPEIEAKIRKHFAWIVHEADGDRDYVVQHMYAYLCGIETMGGFFHAGRFAKAQNDLEEWYNQQE